VIQGLSSFLDEVLGLDPDQRRTVFRVAWVVLMSGHILWACGWLTALGFSGFAKADDLRDQRKYLQRIEIRLLEKSIFEVKVLQCNAASKQLYAQQLAGLLTDYQNLTGKLYPLPSCEELR
jgi:hypothetical protein